MGVVGCVGGVRCRVGEGCHRVSVITGADRPCMSQGHGAASMRCPLPTVPSKHTPGSAQSNIASVA